MTSSTPLPEQWAIKQHIEKYPKCEWLCTHTNLKNLGEQKDEVPLPEQEDFNERLDAILEEFDAERDYSQAKQAINRHYYQKFLEIIGEDEQLYKQGYGIQPIAPNTVGEQQMITRNVFRTELRQQAKLKLLGGEDE